MYLVLLALALTAILSGCSGGQPAVGKNALAFKNEIQSKINVFAVSLAEAMANNSSKKVSGVLEELYLPSSPGGTVDVLFLAVLDNHGVTVATRTEQNLSGARNFGHYQVVSQVIRKRKPLQSSLYLQEGRKVYIVCTPLLNGEKFLGVLIIGIGSEELQEAGITEKEFMSLDFQAHQGVRP